MSRYALSELTAGQEFEMSGARLRVELTSPLATVALVLRGVCRGCRPGQTVYLDSRDSSGRDVLVVLLGGDPPEAA